MNKRYIRALAVLLAAGALPACEALKPVDQGPSGHNAPAQVETLGSLAFRATDQLAAAAQPSLDAGSRVLVTSLVDVDNLERSSTFGRIVSEQISARMTQLGYAVQEVRLRNSLMVREGTGELILSRDLNRIGRESNAQAIVAGTYAVGGRWIYVTLRMIGAGTGRVISAVDFVVPVDQDTAKLVAAR